MAPIAPDAIRVIALERLIAKARMSQTLKTARQLIANLLRSAQLANRSVQLRRRVACRSIGMRLSPTSAQALALESSMGRRILHTMSKLVLYVDSQFLSPYALSAYVALAEKSIEFDLLEVDLSQPVRDAHYMALSLSGRVPTLIDGDFSLSESSAIAEYLEDNYPGSSLYPSDARLRARARQVQAWLRSDFDAIRRERPTDVVFLGAQKAPLSRDAKQAAERLFDAVATLLRPDASGLFERWCIADTDLATMLNRLVLHGDDVPQAQAHYARRQFERVSVRSWLQRGRKV
jgi:glutathione S-transferase